MKQERKQLTWTVVHEVHDKPTGLVVQVTRSDATPPGHSLYLGNRPVDGTADERLRPNTRVAGTYTPVTLKSKAQLVHDLWHEAETWVLHYVVEWAKQNKKPGVQLPGRGVRAAAPQPGRPAQQHVDNGTPSPKDPVNGPRPDLFAKIPGRAT